MSAQASPTALSSLSLVSDSDQAFTLRVTLVRLARRTLDVQYYIWDDDTTGKLLIYRVLEAARRGVKVRMLLDHANQLGAASIRIRSDPCQDCLAPASLPQTSMHTSHRHPSGNARKALWLSRIPAWL